MAKITAPSVAIVVLDNLALLCGTPDITFADNDKKFTSKFFAALGAFPRTKSDTTNEYHFQTNEQEELYDRTQAARLRHYINGHRQAWDIIV